MKKGLLFLVSVLFSLAINAQVVVYTEDFEAPSFDDSVTSTTATGGIKHWEISDKFSVSGANSDTCVVKSGSTTYLTSDFFNTTGNTYVLLEFNHICKITFFDVAEVEVSGDSGVTWNKLTDVHYLGAAAFGTNGSKFAENSYSGLWAPNQNVKPLASWWKAEIFDISAFTANATHAAVRFKLSDGGTPGAQGRYGWILDDLKVTAALSELTPPSIISFTPVLNGNIFSTGPFLFTAEITDVSGILSTFIPYTLNGVADTVWLNNTSGNTYKGTIPAVTHLDAICYRLVAIDNSLSHNTAYSPQIGNHCFTASTEEAALLSITSPATACGLGMEPVTIRIKNTGLTTIAGDFWAKYWIVGTTDTVTEFIPDTILVNALLDYTFDSLVDVSAPTGNMTYQLKASLKLLGDPVATNNTQTKTFSSGFVPPQAPVLYDTINYATTATLTTVIPNATINWYKDSLGTQLLYTGNTFVTPILFSDTVYYRNATSIGALPCSSTPTPFYINVGDKPSWDAALIEIITPVSAINMLAQEKVEVRIVNFGIDTITNLPVSYTINNNTPVTEVYTDTLLPGDTTDFLFTQFADLSVPANYLFKCYVSLSGDTTFLNDTITSMVVHSIPNYCPSYAVNAATGSDIGNVTFSNLNNGNASPTTNNSTAVNGYTDFTSSASSVQLAIGLSYNLVIRKINKSTGNNPSVIKVFIDYDRSGTYDESTELAFTGTTSYFTFQVNSPVTIPAWVNPGVSQMRVVLQETTNAGSVHACGAYGIGETEDYTVVMYPQIPFDAGVATVVTPGALVPEASLQNVTVAIKNYGLDTLTSFNVLYEHNSNPAVSEPWTGLLVPGGTMLFQFTTQIVVAGGPNNICAYTDVMDDSNVGNNDACKSFYGDPLQNAEAVGLPEPSNTGCFVANEPVTISIKNVGLDTINGGLSATYYVVGQQANAVTETVAATILPNATYNYTFNQLVDLKAYVQDTIWDVIAYATLVGDFENWNDTTSTSVESLYSPPDPVITNPPTIPYATAAVLSASSPDSIYWYDTQSAVDELSIGPNYTTPILYGQEVYWVEAQTDGGADLVQIGSGTVTENYVPFYYNYGYGWSAMIYTAAELGIKGDIDTLSFYTTSSLSNYTHIDQKMYVTHTTASTFTSTNKPDPSTMTLVFDDDLVMNGPGWVPVPFTQEFKYNGVDNLLVYWENYETTWSGNPSINWAYTSATSKALYKYQDASFPNLPGTIYNNRPNVKITGGGGGCPSNRIPDTISVTGTPPYDGALLKLISPVSDENLSATEAITVLVKNYGTQSISNFNVSYQINGGAIKTETIAQTLQTQDTLQYTFSTTANLEYYGSYQFKTWISVTNDATGINDTLYRTVKNLVPNYCPSYSTSATTYEDIGNVTFSNLNNGSATPSASNPNATQGYTNYTNLTPAMLSPSVSYPISIAAISASTLNTATPGTNVKVYIDYNRNGVFDILSETVFSGNVNSTNPVATGNVVVPVSAIPGTTVMRVVMDRTGSASPCGPYTYGETEDYLVLIIPMIPKDAGVTQIINPGTLGTTGDVEIVKVKIQNFGTDPLTGIDIAYEVNSGPPVPATYLMTLAPQATAIVNLPSLTLGKGNHHICAYTIVPGDSNTFNDTRCIDDYAEFSTDLPYSNNFDMPAAEMWPDSVENQWERGIPTGTILNSAKSNPNVWGISLGEPYDHNGVNFLYTPKFNYLKTGIDSLSFWHKLNTTAGDGGAIQYMSILGWKLLGSQNDPNSHNWYNSATNIWTGNGGSNAWIHSSFSMHNLTDIKEPTQLRFIFFTIQENNGDKEGWIIDNMRLTIPIIPRDAGVIEVLGPPSPTIIGTDINVEVRIQNFGSDTLFSVPVKYKVNGATVNTGIWYGTLPPDSTAEFTFGPMSSPMTAYTLCAFTDVSGDINSYNNTSCDTFDVLPPNYDLTVKKIIGPLNPTIHGNPAQVTVQVVNQGLQPVSTFDIEYTVAGIVVTTETWSDTFDLAPGDTLFYTFDTSYKHDFIGNYYMCAKVFVPGDGYPWNDEKCIILENLYTEVTESDLEGYSLEQNIPNPASGKTLIPFQLPTYGDYNFVIVNYIGQPVYAEQSKAGAGTHQIEIDADNLTAGVYFYYMEFEGRRLVRKMVIQ